MQRGTMRGRRSAKRHVLGATLPGPAAAPVAGRWLGGAAGRRKFDDRSKRGRELAGAVRLRSSQSRPRWNSLRSTARGAVSRHKFVIASAASSRTLPNTPRDHPQTHDTLPERLAQTNVSSRAAASHFCWSSARSAQCARARFELPTDRAIRWWHTRSHVVPALRIRSRRRPVAGEGPDPLLPFAAQRALGRHQPVLDHFWTDRRTFCVRRRLRVTVRRLGPLEGREVSHPARAAWRSGGAGHAWCHAVRHRSQNEKLNFSNRFFLKSVS